MPEGKIFLSLKGYHIPPNQTLAIDRIFYFCLMKSCVSRKPVISSRVVPRQRLSIAGFAALTEEDIHIICQRIICVEWPTICLFKTFNIF